MGNVVPWIDDSVKRMIAGFGRSLYDKRTLRSSGLLRRAHPMAFLDPYPFFRTYSVLLFETGSLWAVGERPVFIRSGILISEAPASRLLRKPCSASEFGEKPGPGHLPIAHHALGRDLQHFRGFVDA